jgi:hypothetical protein
MSFGCLEIVWAQWYTIIVHCIIQHFENRTIENKFLNSNGQRYN